MPVNEAIKIVLDNTKPLDHPRGDRLPLLLWTVLGSAAADDAEQEHIVRELDSRGVAMIATWDPNNKEKNLAEAMRIARIQKKLSLPVCINATSCMSWFFNKDEKTAHLDDSGEPFFDPSFSVAKVGCPFRIDHRYDAVTEQIEYFLRAYQAAKLPVDFIFGDWEFDGPLEVNRAWEASKRCTVCREQIPGIDDFNEFQKAIRIKRGEATRTCYSDPILSRFPTALAGNYGVYPGDGYRYWYDFYEDFVDYHPHRKEQKATYRQWYDEFPLTGYTFAMPTVYPWARQYLWYDFANPDYHWFYNMLRVASNAGDYTDANVPIIPFVHWHTIYDPDPGEPGIEQMSEWAYQELLWHMLLRGSDTFFLFCQQSEAPAEIRHVHKVWAASLEYADWLDRGTPVTFDVPKQPGPVVSGLRVGDRVLVRRTDFDQEQRGPVALLVGERKIYVPRVKRGFQILEIE